ncbi:hypothetical protein CDAR_380391 [Caerostris darwini]|uniref:Uncharacterized protein n=1 Tax=Caerostris darwini TaxID=1538125 RepID=A0AAV4TKC9_9ARAC|nr:hypothetical protein CDAR_380391 [Caerostris darwini]
MVKGPDRNACTSNGEEKSSDENAEMVIKTFSIEKLTTLSTKLLAGQQQRSFVNNECLLLKNKLAREKHMIDTARYVQENSWGKSSICVQLDN